MSQFDLAFLLLIAGVLVGLRARANVFGMACMVPIVVAAVYVHGRLGGDDLARLMLHSAEGGRDLRRGIPDRRSWLHSALR